MLECDPFNDRLKFNTVNGTIKDVPSNASHLKITCSERRTLMKLVFANLPNIRKLTLDNLNLATWDEDTFRGIANISCLVMNKIVFFRFENHSFNGLTNLRSLEIKHFDELEYMHSDMLKPLEALQSLSFRYIGSKRDALNYEDYGRVLGGITNTRFHKLVLYAIHSVRHQETQLNINDLFRYGSTRGALRHLDLGRNHIDNITGSPATTLPVLEYISLSENIIVVSRGSRSLSQFWKEILAHPHLKTLDVSGMNHMVATTASDISLSVDEDCNRSINITLGAQLQSMSFSNSKLISNSAISSFNFCFIDRLRSLKYIDFSNVRCTKSITSSLANLHGLECINFQNVNMREFATDIFHKMPNLRVLRLGKNDIGSIISNDTETHIFSKNDKLHVLDLAACQLTHIPPKIFSRLQQLHNLNVSKNELIHFHVDIRNIKKLKVLNLSDNKLTTLSAKTRKELDEMTGVEVDISGNPLHCLCNNTDFVTWTQTSKVKFINKNDTFCTGKDNKTNFLFTFKSERLIKTCRPNTGWYLTVLLPLGIVLIVISILLGVVYTYRWKCASCCSRLHIYHMSSDDQLDSIVYERNAFICYNSNDRAWVCKELLTQLEDNQVSTIIHQRDFLPGSVLEESIRESIDKCRYTVLVLSPDFLSSNWCLLEMHLARRRGQCQCREVIVPIILREFPMSKLSPTLVDILKKKSYLKWSDSPDEQVLFWNKLITKLKRGGNIKPLEK